MIGLLRYILGYLEIEISGEIAERILNKAAQNRIGIWNLYCKNQKITGCIKIKDFLKLRTIKKGEKIKIRILKKHGLPFKFKPYKKRYGFMGGFLIFVLILNFLSGYVWIIEIEGNKKTDSEVIIDACKEIGIEIGTNKSKLNYSTAAQRLLLKCPTLAWASLNEEGCVITVNVSESKKSISNENAVALNLVASADGIVEKIDITAGNAVVRVGDAVKKGDILVSGIIEGLGGTQFINSKGTVEAKTFRTYRCKKSFNETVEETTGKITSKSVLCFFGLKIPLYLGDFREEGITSVSQKNLRIFEKNMPVSVITKKMEHTVFCKKNYTQDELEEIINKEIDCQINNDKIDKYTVLKQEKRPSDDGLEIIRIIEAKENIAIPKQINVYNE